MIVLLTYGFASLASSWCPLLFLLLACVIHRRCLLLFSFLFDCFRCVETSRFVSCFVSYRSLIIINVSKVCGRSASSNIHKNHFRIMNGVGQLCRNLVANCKEVKLIVRHVGYFGYTCLPAVAGRVVIL